MACLLLRVAIRVRVFCIASMHTFVSAESVRGTAVFDRHHNRFLSRKSESSYTLESYDVETMWCGLSEYQEEATASYSDDNILVPSEPTAAINAFQPAAQPGNMHTRFYLGTRLSCPVHRRLD
jgi:hypothetical protein